MSGIGFDLPLTASDEALGAMSDDEVADDLADEVLELLTGWLRQHLERPEELACLESIDAEALAEVDPDAFQMGKLRMLFDDKWQLGAEAAWHWYQHAAAGAWDELNGLLSGAKLQLSPPKLTVRQLLAAEEGQPILARGGGALWLVKPDGSFILTKGQALPAGDAVAIATAKKLAADRLCGCGLCAAAGSR